jgi:hypothetical protein
MRLALYTVTLDVTEIPYTLDFTILTSRHMSQCRETFRFMSTPSSVTWMLLPPSQVVTQVVAIWRSEFIVRIVAQIFTERPQPPSPITVRLVERLLAQPLQECDPNVVVRCTASVVQRSRPATSRTDARVPRRRGPPAGSRPAGSPASTPHRRTARSGLTAIARSLTIAAPPTS